MKEKEFENILERYPDLIEEALSIQGRQVAIGRLRVDLLYKDRFGQTLIVELKRGPILRQHIAQIFDYEGHFLSPSNSNIRIMLIGNRVPPNMRRSLEHHGFEWKELTEPLLFRYLSDKNDSEFLQYFEEYRNKPIPQCNSLKKVNTISSNTAVKTICEKKGCDSSTPSLTGIKPKKRIGTWAKDELQNVCDLWDISEKTSDVIKTISIDTGRSPLALIIQIFKKGLISLELGDLLSRECDCIRILSETLPSKDLKISHVEPEVSDLDISKSISDLSAIIQNEINEKLLLSKSSKIYDRIEHQLADKELDFSDVDRQAFAKIVAQLNAVGSFIEELEEFSQVSYKEDVDEIIDRLFVVVNGVEGLAVSGRVQKEIRELLERKRKLPSEAKKEQEFAFQKATRKLELNSRPCTKCAGQMILREGNGNYFWGCHDFPYCWGRRYLTKEELNIINEHI